MDAVNPLGETALMVAAEYCSPESLELLLDHGADPTAADNYGKNAHMHAVGEDADYDDFEDDFENRMREMFEMLIDAGIDVNAVSNKGETALSKAEDRGGQELAIEMLKELGAER